MRGGGPGRGSIILTTIYAVKGCFPDSQTRSNKRKNEVAQRIWFTFKRGNILHYMFRCYITRFTSGNYVCMSMQCYIISAIRLQTKPFSMASYKVPRLPQFEILPYNDSGVMLIAAHLQWESQNVLWIWCWRHHRSFEACSQRLGQSPRLF